jgi:UDP-N-acetylmuramoylalanine-D-glutamate ligase
MKPNAKIFRFAGHNFDKKKGIITFNYRYEFTNRPPLDFVETIILPKNLKTNLDSRALEKFLEPLEIILGISYYKLYAPTKVSTVVKLSKEQADFWNTIYRKGLGEFLYVNNLDPKRIAKFPHFKINTSSVRVKVDERSLVGIGGGKDSLVVADLLKNQDFTSFLLETQRRDEVTENVIKHIGKPFLKIERKLDPKIFTPHEGAYNGHIPISVIYAFIGLLSAALYEYKYVVVGNEHSSTIGNLEYRGEIINHQWSKFVEFELMLQDYTRKFITPDITYFSLLRSLHEIKIVQKFSRLKSYFPIFTSCNRNFKAFKDRPDSLWCGECPKCAFVFLILSAFLTKEELLGIFKKNLFADESLLPLFADLLGFGKFKPLDCVGTPEESQAALFLAAEKFKHDIVVKTFLPQLENPQTAVTHVLQNLPAPTIPTPFRFLGVKKVCILGYGKEGKITEKYLRQNYPHLEVGILDQERDKDYLSKLSNFDLAVKTPGIPKEKVTIPYVTATNIFLSQIKNFTIGVTGSKGKSTTASLVYEILKTAGKKVRLIGNIGNPMLGVLLEKVDPKEIFVIELSSYMLDDIEYSPNIALLLNLFPEHMNYHGTVENYYKAKRNIFKFQKPGDLAVQAPFKETIPLKNSAIPLIGNHNLENIKAAIKVCRSLKVSDTAIKKALKSFKPLPHRLQLVGEFSGIRFYDDAISTTPESTIMAIKALKEVDTIFLGGEDRGYNFKELEKVLRSGKIKNLVLFPDSGQHILKSTKGFNILETRSMREAVKFAFAHTQKGKICLLSCASPSYSLWKNFEEKGDLFQALVREFSTQ